LPNGYPTPDAGRYVSWEAHNKLRQDVSELNTKLAVFKAQMVGADGQPGAIQNLRELMLSTAAEMKRTLDSLEAEIKALPVAEDLRRDAAHWRGWRSFARTAFWPILGTVIAGLMLAILLHQLALR